MIHLLRDGGGSSGLWEGTGHTNLWDSSILFNGFPSQCPLPSCFIDWRRGTLRRRWWKWRAHLHHGPRTPKDLPWCWENHSFSFSYVQAGVFLTKSVCSAIQRSSWKNQLSNKAWGVKQSFWGVRICGVLCWQVNKPLLLPGWLARKISDPWLFGYKLQINFLHIKEFQLIVDQLCPREQYQRVIFRRLSNHMSACSVLTSTNPSGEWHIWLFRPFLSFLL